jgi:CubicO group peptidase (beta-lactamase class C family)
MSLTIIRRFQNYYYFIYEGQKMRRTPTFYLLITLILFQYSTYSQEYLDFKESDPIKLGWMKGFPPPKEKVISAIDGSFFRFPALRYSVCHMRQFMPTTEVKAASTDQYKFEIELDSNIDTVTFIPWNSSEPMTWNESLAKNYTDGILILHKGKIVYEKYFGELKPDGVYAAMSVSKTFTGTLGALLIEEGLLDENKTGADYIPELKNSAFGDATIRQILDMTTGLKYSEDYSDPNAEIWSFSAAGNPFKKKDSYSGPTNYYDYLVTVQKEGEHGEVFGYKTINTDVMGWIISRVTGKSIPELLSERIWKQLGTHVDGYFQIDGAGIAFAGGGFSASMRDMAMFGEMVRNMGYFNKQQILPSTVVEDIMIGGDKELFRNSVYGTSLQNWSYRNMWWIIHDEHGAFAARGVHGQTIYIDPKSEMVIVRFASHPEAKNSKIDPNSLPAYHSVARYLMNLY